MAAQIYCDPCSENNKNSPAIQYCCHCEENLCKQCVECHSRIQTLKSHHLKDLPFTENKVPPSTRVYCKIHSDTLLDFYCQRHDTPCCTNCIPTNHPGCDSILPLDLASNNVRNSSLLSDTIDDVHNLLDILRKLHENRELNLKSLAKTKLVIQQQIKTVKSRLLKQLDDLENNLTSQLSSIEMTNEAKIENQRIEIAKLESRLTKNKHEFEFMQARTSESHLFLVLHQLAIDTKLIETDIKRLISSTEEVSVEFDIDKVHDLSINTMGSINEITSQCTIEYKYPKVLQAQMNVAKKLTVFKKIEQINLKSGESYSITDVAVSNDNKLLLSNFSNHSPKVYIYKDCKDYENKIQCPSSPYGISVIPDTDTAVVTLPLEMSIQFINIKHARNGNTVQQGFRCWGITATKENIIVGGKRVIHILDKHGSKVAQVTVGAPNIFSIHFDTVKSRLLCRYDGGMCCVTLDGKLVYQYKVSGEAGLVVDQQGHVYLRHTTNEIHRLSSEGKFHDVVLTKDNGISYPYAMAFNKNFTKLFIVHDRHKSVSVLRCM